MLFWGISANGSAVLKTAAWMHARYHLAVGRISTEA